MLQTVGCDKRKSESSGIQTKAKCPPTNYYYQKQ